MQRRAARDLAVCLLLSAMPAYAQDGGSAVASHYVERVARADATAGRVPPLSQVAPQIGLSESYDIQRRLIARKRAEGKRVSGYKAGLVRPGQRLGDRPVEMVFGALFDAGRQQPGARIERSKFRTLVAECEIAFTFARPVRDRIASVAELKARVGSLRPAVELPDLSLDGPMRVEQDLVAINIGSADYILGAPLSARTTLGNPTARLLRDGQLVATGEMRTAVGDGWDSLLRLVNLIVSKGHDIERGQTIVNGALIAVPSPATGSYRAEFGPLGAIDFDIVE